jgi:hypothetical protein
MANDVEQRVGDTGYLVRTKGMVDRAGLRKRELFLENLGRTVEQFCAQIGTDGLERSLMKERLGEKGWRSAVLFTTHMFDTLMEQDKEFESTPWKLITISLCPAQRATDASPDQMKCLDNLIDEARRHCARLDRSRKAS